MTDYKKLSNLQLDALREVGNIGAAHAATALSQIINKTIMISISRIDIIPLSEVSKVVGGRDVETAVVQMRILGDVEGIILLALKNEDALSFADIIKGQPIGITKEMKELEESALKEAGSILSASYLKAIGELLKLMLISSVPYIFLDKMGVVLDKVLADLSKRVELAFCIETEFKESASSINGHFLLIPDLKGLELILKALGVEN
ncbi:MAG: chemotaxis protein CheC [Candidatus Omnitrophota bacterium]